MGKSYLLAPTRDNPPNGPIALGNIIASPSAPEDRLNPTPTLLNLPIHESYQTNFLSEVSRYKAGKIGIWTSFLQSLGIGIDLSINYEIANTEKFEFESLETRFFTPDRQFVERSMEGDDVQEFIKKSKFKANVYMIIGIKIARGASVTSTKLREKGLHVQFGVDATPMGVPLSIGPNVEVEGGPRESTAFESAEGFVFAYRLREVFYSRKQGLVIREYNKGAIFGIDGGSKFEAEVGG